MHSSDIIPSENAKDISEHLFADETDLINKYIKQARFSSEESKKIEQLATELAKDVRTNRTRYGGVDAFMQEYALNSHEGIMLMCLAEALLRIPDSKTADKLIADKIGEGDWDKHIGHSDSLFVNASTWGLMLTGQIIDMGDVKGEGFLTTLKRIVARSGEPVIREAMRHAMRILGDQFVLGQTIEAAIENSKQYQEQGYSFSFDMLGEGAPNAKDAEVYYERYLNALSTVSQIGHEHCGGFQLPSLSIKLSALHPRYEEKHEARVINELVLKLQNLLKRAREVNIAITIDAEEASRLGLSLKVFTLLFQDPNFASWGGLGLAVQAYSKRALAVLRYLDVLATMYNKTIPVRLVKGAYWDSEIKWAQEQGLENYPVFTRKTNTDVSYITAARFLLSKPEVFYPQFATHNAHSIATIMTLAGDRSDYEFQRLHGMGEGVYERVIAKEGGYAKPCRVYAPVGGHEDLLAYLVRRLLENGANTSFINRLADDAAPISEIIQDPFSRADRNQRKDHPNIQKPENLFFPERLNSKGSALWDELRRTHLIGDIESAIARPVSAGPIIGGKAFINDQEKVLSPQNRTVIVGNSHEANWDNINEAFQFAKEAQASWDEIGGNIRAKYLEKAADLFEDNKAKLMGLLIKEAGKSFENAQDELREAIDFLRYYAVEAKKNFSEPITLPGPTGEENVLSLHGRGTFVCISPWNFPLAIFTGQVSAALAAGNAVLAKPAEQTPLVAFIAVQLMHQAGIPTDLLHLVIGRGETVGASLVKHPDVAGIAFTGSDVTARLINRSLAEKDGPIIPLIAETGGVNAMIVDSTALPEQVVRDVIRSAFDSAGQRCSALRILFLQEDVADKILAMLIGAVQELKIGDPLSYETDIGPVIDEAALGLLNNHKIFMDKNAIKIIELDLPQDCKEGTFVSPAIYELNSYRDIPGEVFGPILHVIRYTEDSLDQVCEAINKAGYGLTLGIHSRISDRANYIARRVHVGNIYVNRNQVGAVVGVQPFGGENLSGTGPKAGGPNYLKRFSVERVRTTDVTAAGGNVGLLGGGTV